MKKILLISAYINPYVHNNNRVQAVGSTFIRKNWKVKILTQNFSHSEKKYYNSTINNLLFDTDLIKVVSYNFNLGIKRIFSHIGFAFKSANYLDQNISKYDVIYTTMPTIFSAYLILRLCKRFNKPLIIDVIDLWPESMYEYAWRFRNLTKMMLYPIKFLAHYIYKSADIVVTASRKYANHVSKTRKCDVKYFYQGIDLEFISTLIKQSNIEISPKEEEEIWIVYGGLLGNAYDFHVIIDALIYLKQEQINYKMIFAGGGELQEKIQEQIDNYKLNAVITGRLLYSDFLKLLSSCDIAINSFRKNSIVAYSYKFNDYVATGCCILNNLKGETAELIDMYQIGVNFDYDNNNSLRRILLKLVKNKNLLNYYKTNTNNSIQKILCKKSIYDGYYEYIISKLIQ